MKIVIFMVNVLHGSQVGTLHTVRFDHSWERKFQGMKVPGNRWF